MAERWRYLTPSEIACAKKVFSDGLDYRKIRIYRGIPGLPHSRNAVSPNGHIYFPRNHFPPDFACADVAYQMWLIHELTHVWQYQKGFRTWWAGLLLMAVGGYFRSRAYRYPPLSEITCFSDLNMEQQADFLAHYYAARYLPANRHTPQLAAYRNILQPFLADPTRRTGLPKYWPLPFYRK
ncbi:type IV secretion protein Rhs [Neisseria sp. ZJ106]|uniref:Type IV secretion protein Rhs n=1 Tax=Neisseria lisongii TaxID=2912188 RepID=A0ABY7RHY4_9NEIS|nr:type IV secretion protein Rhs [Neisseria lisongii]MCF7522154.1 type IV secretion protein Rhs [Neisseria lisongii]WCL70899.1 type IV secretion protein Rhs [Neisseria lisongii]